MPLGNSITQGNTQYPSYRYQLWKQLIDADIDFEFVGSHDVNNGGSPAVKGEVYKGKVYTNVNEGHWGWRTDQILNGHNGESNKGKLADWLQSYTPDLVLMHLGTNDIFQKPSNEPIETTIEITQNEIREIINALKAKNPNVVILLAQLIPIYPTDSDVNGYITQFNNQIPNLAASLNQGTAEYVYVVDQNTGFDPAHSDSNPEITKDTYDKIHPNTSGELKMATKWSEAIQTALANLPVTLVSFKAEVLAAGKVKLHWSTAMELNNDYFSVERSIDGSTYETIGRVKGSGNSSTKISYTFLDTSPPAEEVYYRLRQVDFDGTVSLSPVIVARTRGGTKNEMIIYPTISNGQPSLLQLRSLLPYDPVEINIFSPNGQLLKQYRAAADAAGNLQLFLDLLSRQVQGLYLVKVRVQDHVLVGKVMVEK
ncbi:GDSL-type esterase/lipase family protein [Pontibacter sp. 13R65]|uniref:GDSL-type esterase/lipase family protein n=1 Tax=Pontibacter sp. 13R65 TaxID=3127458 RepID=UPI00301CBD5C